MHLYRNSGISSILLILLPALAQAQFDKVAALGSDSAITPMGGPASAPPIETWPYDFSDFRPTGRLNDELPKWLQFGLEERMRVEDTRTSLRAPASDGYLLQRFRFGMVLRPTGWFRVFAQVQDARSFFQTPPLGPPNENRWDLKVAYAELGDPEKSWFSLRVGRQQVDYNNTILAGSEWRNQGRAYDGVVANLHPGRVRLGLIAASVVVPLASGISHHTEGNNIYGMYGGIDRVIPHSAIEPFVLWRVSPAVAVETAKGSTTGKLNETAFGARLRGKEIGPFDYRAEWIGERGSAGSNTIRAWAASAGAGYRVSEHGETRVFGGYDYGSGDRNAHDGVHGTFDTMYPTAHDQFGITDQFSRQNIIADRIGASVQPHRRLSLTAQFLNLWEAQTADGIYNTSGGLVFRPRIASPDSRIGEELDAYAWYEINREIHIGAGIGRLFAGPALAQVNNGRDYSYPYFTVEMLDGKRVH